MDGLGPRRGSFGADRAGLWRSSAVLMVVLLPLPIKAVLRADSLEPWQVVASFAALFLVPVLLAAFWFPLAWLYRVHVHEQGIRGYDAWGRFRAARWSVMAATREMHFPGLSWVVVSTTVPGVTLTVPHFLARQDEFERLVAELAGAANPLVRHFASARHAD